MAFESNISAIFPVLRERIDAIKGNPEPILRTAALTVMAAMRPRIHRDGKASDGNQIGTYSPGYMKVRTGDFKNADRYTRGKNKGKNKNAGTFTDRTIVLDKNTGVFSGEDKVGKARPQYHRSADTKVIASLTRQLEQDYAIVPTAEGIGIGFNNQFNYQKATWVEATYKKPIFTQITAEENELMIKAVEEFLPEYFTGF